MSRRNISALLMKVGLDIAHVTYRGRARRKSRSGRAASKASENCLIPW